MGRLSAALLSMVSALLLGAGIIVALPAAGEERIDLSGTPTRLDRGWEPLAGPLGLTGAARAGSGTRKGQGVGTAAPGSPEAPAAEPAAAGERGAANGASAEDGAGVQSREPIALAIPSLEVVSQVVATGITAQREMEIPPVDQAGWYRYGPRPGDPAGSAVVAAHVDYEGEPGVFQRLRELEMGESVLMADATGRWREFVVGERFQLDKGDLASADLFRRGGPPVLTLVTCGGEFDESSRNYEDNIVIRATAVDA